MQEVMRGVKRIAALGFQTDWDYIEKCHLTKYELASIAPLHDVKGLIRNYFDELLHHGSEEDKEIIRNIKAVELDSKDKVTYITYYNLGSSNLPLEGAYYIKCSLQVLPVLAAVFGFQLGFAQG